MHPQKELYAKEVFQLVKRGCSQVTKDRRKAIELALHLSEENLQEIIKKIMIALPDVFFYRAKPVILYDMLCFISKHIILFQVQEDLKEEHYVTHLFNFIQVLSKGIHVRYYSA